LTGFAGGGGGGHEPLCSPWCPLLSTKGELVVDPGKSSFKIC